MDKPRDVLTTGQVAKICNVAPRTVSKWFDSGQLRGYRIPGSKDRRIPVQHLIRFMKAHGIPLNGLETGSTRILIVDSDRELTDLLRDRFADEESYEIKVAAGAFEAGTLLTAFEPHVIIVDVTLPDVDTKQLCRLVTSDSERDHIRLIAMSGSLTEGDAQALLQEGFNAYIKKPFELTQLRNLIEQQLSPTA